MKNKRKLNPNLIKSKQAYTLAELAETYEKHIRTVQNWRKKGLNVLEEDSRPYLVLGSEVQRFLREKNESAKKKLKEGEFYCVKCRSNVRSIPQFINVDYTRKKIGKSQYQAIIHGICEKCGTGLNLFSTEEKVKDLISRGVMVQESPLILIENYDCSPNTDL